MAIRIPTTGNHELAARVQKISVRRSTFGVRAFDRYVLHAASQRTIRGSIGNRKIGGLKEFVGRLAGDPPCSAIRSTRLAGEILSLSLRAPRIQRCRTVSKQMQILEMRGVRTCVALGASQVQARMANQKQGVLTIRAGGWPGIPGYLVAPEGRLARRMPPGLGMLA